MKDAILELIKIRQHVSVVELWNEIPGFKGDLEWYCGSTVIWNSCSDVAIEAMNHLMMERKIKPNPCSPMIFMTDGKILDLPTPDSPIFDSKKPHWLPVSFSTPEQAKRDGAK